MSTLLHRRSLLVAGLLPLVLPLAGAAHATALPRVLVTKDPSCGCCDGWADHVKAAGYPVEVVISERMAALKQRLGVPPELASCHTAEVDGYVLEGHVPVAAIARLLAERPAARGLAVPGMPAGSPGMDFPGVTPEPYEAYLFGTATSSFGRYLGAAAL